MLEFSMNLKLIPTTALLFYLLSLFYEEVK